MEASDQELLRAFVRERSEEAFRRLVNRHLNLVFATARRILGDPQLAEEVAQGVFLLLARKAGDIGNQQPLAGWLYHTARHHALNASRAEGRRRQREQTAAAMQTNETTPEPEWIAAELEGALEELPAEDRDALVLRFLDNRQLREVGVELGISEEAARKRVSRALDKLRGIFGKRGVALSTGLLTTALAAQAGAVAPAGLGASIVASALTGLTAASATALTATQTTTTLMNLLNLKTTAAILGAAAVTGTTTYLVQEREADRLRADYQTLNETHGKLAADQQEARALIQLRDEQIERLKRHVADLPRLRGEVDKLNRKLLEAERLAAAQELSKPRLDESQNDIAGDASVEPQLTEDETDPEMREAKSTMLVIKTALEQFKLENNGRIPDKIEALSNYLSEDNVNHMGGLGRYVLYGGFSEMSPDQLRQVPTNAVVITDREARRTQDGEYFQTYYLADGRVEVVKGGGIVGGPGQLDVMVRLPPTNAR
jgi:RNA polymerase sigma factor (sigma-70 family)